MGTTKVQTNFNFVSRIILNQPLIKHIFPNYKSFPLIDAKTDNHIWSEIYNRPFGDIFNIQSDIAKNVANQLKIQLTEEEKKII